MFRIGQSRDIHRLENNNRPGIISGVVYHGLAEAMLGSLALGDLGTFFPDNDDKYLDMDSKEILLKCYSFILEEGYKISNIDINIICERPKLKDKILLMRQNIAYNLNLELSQVSIKAQTNEKCGEIGLIKAIEATACILIYKD